VCFWKGLRDIGFGRLSGERHVVGVAEVPEVEGIGDDQAQAPPEGVGPIAAPQLEGVITPDDCYH